MPEHKQYDVNQTVGDIDLTAEMKTNLGLTFISMYHVHLKSGMRTGT